MTAIPSDASNAETLWCTIPLQEKHLKRFTEIAFEDMNQFFKQRPELESHRICVVLAQGGASHYVNKKGFRCLSVFTFFRKVEGVRAFHPLRHTRVDFGSNDFGHSSWIKHPCDRGFVGRGINCYGRTIPVQENESIQNAIQRYAAKSKVLSDHPMVILWPNNLFGTVVEAV